ncbi:MAG: phytanoyl-CoA dioxygenase family protein [Gammaproteobacteria bacterium]|nr:phytanoyl-CoA dioxygenase family protein [Gammaproteobacteria bacterium]
MLNPAQVEHYHTHGYVIPDLRLPEALITDMDGRISRLIDAHPEFRDNCPALLRYDMGFADYCRTPPILDMVAQLIGDDIALWNMSLFAKPAGNGKATPWHQDGEYWPIRPLATCTVWVAIDAATRENGCLRIVPGSHREQKLYAHRTNESPALTLHQELCEDQFDEAEAVDLVLERGQISLHDVYLMHGSAPNTSPKRRRGLTMRFMPTTSVYDLDIAEAMFARGGKSNLALNPVLLMRGEDRTGRNRFHATSPVQRIPN